MKNIDWDKPIITVRGVKAKIIHPTKNGDFAFIQIGNDPARVPYNPDGTAMEGYSYLPDIKNIYL